MLNWTLRGLIRLYQLVISPLLPPRCRYLPSCSDYAIEALARRGVLAGLFLALRRIARCHPWGGSGYDPVPPAGWSNMAPRDISLRQHDCGLRQHDCGAARPGGG